MPKLSSSVGRGAPNKSHDVALIQAALANLPASPNSPFDQKIWTKPIDGRTSPELERAIILFQSNNRITQSGRIDPMGPDIQTLDRTLPPDRKGIAAVENRTAVLFTSINVSAMTQAQEALRKRTLLPGPAAEQLGDVVRNIQKQMGLVLRPDGHGIDQQGRMIQKLAFADTHWMNNSGQFTPQIPMDKAQQVVSALLRRPLPSLLEWHTGPMPFGHAPVHQAQRVGNMIGASGGGMGNVVLAIRVKQGLRCLSGSTRPLDTQRLQRVGLQRTGDPVADRIQDVAAAEIEAGNAGANELGIIGDIFKGLFDGASNVIRTANAGQGGAGDSRVVRELKAQISAGKIIFQGGGPYEAYLLGRPLGTITVTTKLQELVLELSKLTTARLTINSILRGNPPSHHALGRAVDIDDSIAPTLLPAIGDQGMVSRLGIDDLIFDAGHMGETDRNRWNFNTGRPHRYGTRLLEQHRNHIHISVFT